MSSGVVPEAAKPEQTEQKKLNQGKIGLTLFICLYAVVTVAGGFYWLGIKKRYC